MAAPEDTAAPAQICAHIQHQLLKVPDKVQKRLCLERHINENQMQGWLCVDRTLLERLEDAAL